MDSGFYPQFQLAAKISHYLPLQVTLLNLEYGKLESWSGIIENGAMETWSLCANEKKRKPKNRNRSIFSLTRTRMVLLGQLGCTAFCSFDSSFFSNLKLEVPPSPSKMKAKY